MTTLLTATEVLHSRENVKERYHAYLRNIQPFIAIKVRVAVMAIPTYRLSGDTITRVNDGISEEGKLTMALADLNILSVAQAFGFRLDEDVEAAYRALTGTSLFL